MSEDPVEVFLLEAFEENFERLRQETGRSISPDVKVAALRQVLLYWRKLRPLAERVTETEVKLTLPDQESPAGRRFTLEGVVDIVRDDDQTTMYDLKTHIDADAARDEIEPFCKQLNVYAHIWQHLRGQPLDEAAIIASRPTRPLRQALDHGTSEQFEAALEAWEPLVYVDVAPEDVEGVIREFGGVVDRIEEHDFAPPPVEVLLNPIRPSSHSLFGRSVCRNCDARFSCNSYRRYLARSNPNRGMDASILRDMEDFGNEFERNEWTDANLETEGHVRFEEE